MNETVERQGAATAADFERFYQSEIAPHAAELEQARQARVGSFYRRIGISVPLLAILGGGLYLAGAFEGQPVWIFVILVIGAIGAFVWIGRPADQHREALKELVIGPVCSFLGGLTYSRKAKDGFDLAAFRDNGVVGSFNRSSLEDLFAGSYRDTAFRMVEAKLKRRRRRGRGGSSSRTVFKGLLFDIAVPAPFSCRILLTGDKGGLVNRIEGFFRDKFGGREPVVFDHPAFEERYQVFSDDPAAARALMAPALLDSLVALAQSADRKALTAGFAEGRFLLALPHRRDLFEIGKLHRSLDHLEEDVTSLLREITLAHRIVDYLHGDRPELLP